MNICMQNADARLMPTHDGAPVEHGISGRPTQYSILSTQRLDIFSKSAIFGTN